jgi:nucleotide-binding universal stress UspA family protein
MKLILAPVDFSPVSRSVVETAAELAKAIDGYVVLVHVVPLPTDAADYAMAVSGFAGLVAREERRADRKLAVLREIPDARAIPSRVVCRRGDPRRLIPEIARNFAADYVIVGSRGHTAWRELVTGSTARAVIQGSNCAVIVVPPAAPARAPVRAEMGRRVTTGPN